MYPVLPFFNLKEAAAGICGSLISLGEWVLQQRGLL
jgi:hypothetical protein